MSAFARGSHTCSVAPFDAERPRQVVDVFRGAAEVDELAEILGPDLH
jgi:hypothetical protein